MPLPLLAGICWTKVSWEILHEARFSYNVNLHPTANEFDNLGIRELKPWPDCVRCLQRKANQAVVSDRTDRQAATGDADGESRRP